jgi:hypothetical protein
MPIAPPSGETCAFMPIQQVATTTGNKGAKSVKELATFLSDFRGGEQKQWCTAND